MNSMVHIKLVVFCILLSLICAACPTVDGTEILEVDKHVISYQSVGGCDTITMLSDYDSWWLYCIREEKVEYRYNEKFKMEECYILEEKRYYYNPEKYNISLNVSGMYEMYDSMQFVAEDFSLTIPEEAPNTIIVTCHENKDSRDRIIYVFLRATEHGNFCELAIRQEGTEERQ